MALRSALDPLAPPPPGTLLTIHGPPGSGKTAVALRLLTTAAQQGPVVLIDGEALPRQRLQEAVRRTTRTNVRHARAATATEMETLLDRARIGLRQGLLNGVIVDGALTPARFDREWAGAWRSLHALRHQVVASGAWAVLTVATANHGAPLGGTALTHLATGLVRLVPDGPNAGLALVEKGAAVDQVAYRVDAAGLAERP